MQIGVLPSSVPHNPTADEAAQVLRLPVAGLETAEMLIGHGTPNEMLGPSYGVSKIVHE